MHYCKSRTPGLLVSEIYHATTIFGASGRFETSRHIAQVDAAHVGRSYEARIVHAA